jgi:hypothetical protein
MHPESVVFACDMSALSPRQRTHHLSNIRSIFAAVRAIRELPDGYEFEFTYSSDSLDALADFVAHEKLCCPFFSFGVQVEPAADTLSLRLTGPDGVKPCIRAELSPAIPSHLRQRAS